MAKPTVSLLERLFMNVILIWSSFFAFLQLVNLDDPKFFLEIPVLLIGGIGLIIYFVWWIVRENPSHSK